jgi:hypothetical protein
MSDFNKSDNSPASAPFRHLFSHWFNWCGPQCIYPTVTWMTWMTLRPYFSTPTVITFGVSFELLLFWHLMSSFFNVNCRYLQGLCILRFAQYWVFLIPSPIIEFRTLWKSTEVNYSRYLWIPKMDNFEILLAMLLSLNSQIMTQKAP